MQEKKMKSFIEQKFNRGLQTVDLLHGIYASSTTGSSVRPRLTGLRSIQ